MEFCLFYQKSGVNVESYIVRIYLRDSESCCPVRGVVEEVGAVGQDAFGNKEELWNILSGLKQPEQQTGSHANRGSAKKQDGTE